MISLTILGAPRTKKTHNRVFKNKKTGRRHFMPSEAWAKWVANAVIRGWDPGDAMNELDHPSVQWNCRALFYRDRDIGDAVGYYQGLADFLEKRGIIANDAQLKSWDGSRLLIDRQRPRVEVELTDVQPTGDAVAPDMAGCTISSQPILHGSQT